MKNLISPILFILCVSWVSGIDYRINLHPVTPIQTYALNKLQVALSEAGHTAVSSQSAFEINFELGGDLERDAFAILATPHYLTLKAADGNGLLYGALDIVESIRSGTYLDQFSNKSESPANAFRAIKFNLPWRSYRFGPALSQHMETARDLAFWERFLDMMVENRFNALTLWNLHPFSNMIRARNFPFACDLKNDEELADWQNFYHELFRLAMERGIDTYIVNWNIFVPDGFVEHYGLPRDQNIHKWNGTVSQEMDEIIRRYTRESVTQTLEEYPNLTGIGLSLGEAMNGMDESQREEWVLDTIVRGAKEAKRPARLIHRVPFSGGNTNFGDMDRSTEILTRQAIESLEGVGEPVLVEVKFNWSHAHSTPQLVKVHGGAISDTYWNPEPRNYKLIWMARNEDFFFLRWGQADFIREHIRKNRQSYVGGYFVGSEMYIPALDYFTKPEKQVDWDYAFERQWLFYKMWGRLLYNPDTPDRFFSEAFDQRYGKDYARLFDAYSVASQIPLLITSNWNVTHDRSFYAEMFMSNRREPNGRSNLISVKSLIAESPLDPSLISIREYVDASLSNKLFPVSRVTPLMLADKLDDLGNRAALLVEGLNVRNDTLAYELGDIQAWSQLACYVADKIRGATAFHFFEKTGDEAYKIQAVAFLEKAKTHWIELVHITEGLYPEAYCQILPNGSEEKWHWSKLLPAVQEDITYVSEH